MQKEKHSYHAAMLTSYLLLFSDSLQDGPGLDSSLAISNMASTRGGIGTCLTGIVVFTDRAESHRGFCHGGSMCSIMDDVIGWAGFLVSGDCKPWSGFTVQVNTRLTKPIMIHSTLLIQATIRNVEGRKVYIDATLSDPSDDSIHSACEGIFIANKGIIST